MCRYNNRGINLLFSKNQYLSYYNIIRDVISSIRAVNFSFWKFHCTGLKPSSIKDSLTLHQSDRLNDKKKTQKSYLYAVFSLLSIPSTLDEEDQTGVKEEVI